MTTSKPAFINVDDIPSRIITLDETEYVRCKQHVVNGGFNNISRFNAVFGRDKRQEYLGDLSKLTIRAVYEIEHSKVREAHSSLPSWGGIGCYLSHVQLWEEAAKSQQGLFIFEADAVPKPETYKTVKSHLKKLKDKGKYVDQYVFGHCGAVSSVTSGVPGVRLATGRLYGLAGYYISPEGAMKLLKHIYPIEVQIDAYTGYMIPIENIKIYYPTKVLAKQHNVGGTKIQTKTVKDALIDSGSHTNALGIDGQVTGMIFVVILFVLILLGFVILYWNHHRRQRKLNNRGGKKTKKYKRSSKKKK